MNETRAVILDRRHPLAKKRRWRKVFAGLASMLGIIWYVRIPFRWAGGASWIFVAFVALISVSLVSRWKKKQLDEEIERMELRFSDAEIEIGAGQLSEPDVQGEPGALSEVSSAEGALSDPKS